MNTYVRIVKRLISSPEIQTKPPFFLTQGGPCPKWQLRTASVQQGRGSGGMNHSSKETGAQFKQQYFSSIFSM